MGHSMHPKGGRMGAVACIHLCIQKGDACVLWHASKRGAHRCRGRMGAVHATCICTQPCARTRAAGESEEDTHTAAAACVLLGVNCFHGEGWLKMANAIVHVLEHGDDGVEDEDATFDALDALVADREVRLAEFAAGVHSLEEKGGTMTTCFPAVDLCHASTLFGP